MQFNLKNRTRYYFVRTSLITFLFGCMIALAALMLLLGMVFQIGSMLAPWLLNQGWTFLCGTLLLFGLFRISVLTARIGRRLNHRCKQYLFYRDLLLLSQGTLRFLLEKLRQVLFL